MRTQAQRSAKDNFVEHRRRGVNQQIATACRTNDRPQVSSVCFHNFYSAFLSEKLFRAFRVAVSTPYGMSLTDQQMGQQGACAAHAENEYTHRLATLPHSTIPSIEGARAESVADTGLRRYTQSLFLGSPATLWSPASSK